MDFITIIIFLGIAQGIFIGILLLTLKRGNIKANRLLGLLMIIFSVSISGFLAGRIITDSHFFFLVELPSSVILLIGPMFYFYVLALVKKDYNLDKKSALHFIPFTLLMIFNLIFYSSNSAQTVTAEYSRMFSPLDRIMIGLQIIHVFIYTIVIKKILTGHELKVKSTLSFTDNINLKWLKLTVIVLQVIFGIIAVSVILLSAGINLEAFITTFIPVLAALVILGLGYWGFKQPIIIPFESGNSKARKYEWSTLSEEKADNCMDKLMFIMHDEKPYLDSGLTLQKLAEVVDISPQHLSQVINERMNQNFFDFINGFRIKEAKRLLVDPKGELLTILAVAEEVGFNSKSSFNTAFKKITGMTPTEYKKSVSLNNF